VWGAGRGARAVGEAVVNDQDRRHVGIEGPGRRVGPAHGSHCKQVGCSLGQISPKVEMEWQAAEPCGALSVLLRHRCAERRAQLFMVMDKKVLATSNDNVMEFLRLLQER